MEWLTEDAKVTCDHGGIVRNKPSQNWVRIADRRVLVATDPEGRTIAGCPNINVLLGLRACLTTLVVRTGYSEFVSIDGHSVSLRSVQGLTDGTPPGTVTYRVLAPGQALVGAGS